MACPSLSCTSFSRFNKSQYSYNESRSIDAKRYDIIYGVDPISAVVLDRSIARTWPISSWTINISTNNIRLPWYPTLTLETTSLFSSADRQNVYQPLYSNVWRYGDYEVTLNAQASTTSIASNKIFKQYVKISEFEPFANFWAISGFTVPSNFSVDNSIPISSQILAITGDIPNASLIDNISTCFDFVSGYAPHVTVYFQESSEAHTFPISSYHWNFGDSYNEGPADIYDSNSNYYTITDVHTISGSFEVPCWVSDKQGHIASHTYIMPGTYDISLTVYASCTNTSDICARYTSINDVGRFYVYVEEIPPRCNNPIYASLSSTTGFTNLASSISGNISLTSYFMASSIIAGSFPIGRIDWDFGDGDVQKIVRRPYTSYTSQGLPVINISAYGNDIEDPRNVIVPHIYTNNTNLNQSFSINISAYACNTNTMITCSADEIISPLTPKAEERKTSTKYLIGSRFDDKNNLIYIFEDK
jgi:hypothetical protein